MTLREYDKRARVSLSPADWERVEALAQAEGRSVANMLGRLVAAGLRDREAQEHLAKLYQQKIPQKKEA